MSEIPVKYGKSMSLQALSDVIGGDEARYGTLKALAAGAADNYAIIRRGKAPTPSVRLCLGSQAPDGTVAVCSGRVWILDAQLDVIAVR